MNLLCYRLFKQTTCIKNCTISKYRWRRIRPECYVSHFLLRFQLTVTDKNTYTVYSQTPIWHHSSQVVVVYWNIFQTLSQCATDRLLLEDLCKIQKESCLLKFLEEFWQLSNHFYFRWSVKSPVHTSYL